MDELSDDDTASDAQRVTSMRLKNLGSLERAARELGFKDCTHFFQLCTDALLRVHQEGRHLQWPPSFVTGLKR
jgi:hypothetical protein